MGEHGMIYTNMTQFDDGSVLVSEGNDTFDMFGDTMQLAIARTVRDVYLMRTGVFSVLAAGAVWGAYGFDNKALSIASGVVGAISALTTLYNGVRSVPASKEYAQTLDEVVSHGWAPREQLKTIDSRYL